MYMKKLILVALATLTITGCASNKQAQVATVKQQQVDVQATAKKARLDVKETVSNLLDYCEKWASAYEANLGKDPVEAFEECVQLTADNMTNQAKERIEGKSSNPADFPFNR
tara:strand:- start:1314 stop:1649 length:336 start_codon:yes stop_codon:yes gene_type:complete